jgi:hypothetical protein
MTLDLILFRPEFFYLFSFFVLLWYGTGNLVTPVSEIFTVTTVNRQQNYYPEHSTIVNKQYSANQTRGPNHAVSALT